MKAALLLGALYLSIGAGMTARTVYEAVTSRTGYAAYYQKPGQLEAIARKRGIDHPHPVASPWEDIGTRLRVCSKRACINAIVADVCRPGPECRRIRAKQIIAELSYRDNGLLCRYYNELPRSCLVRVSRN